MLGLLDNEQSEVFQPIGKLSKKYSYIQIGTKILLNSNRKLLLA
jgi:hypothetical protein